MSTHHLVQKLISQFERFGSEPMVNHTHQTHLQGTLYTALFNLQTADQIVQQLKMTKEKHEETYPEMEHKCHIEEASSTPLIERAPYASLSCFERFYFLLRFVVYC